MFNEKPKKTAEVGQNTHIAYDDYKLQISQKLIQILAAVIAVVNLILIVPDWLFTSDLTTKVFIAVVRVLYSAGIVTIGYDARSDSKAVLSTSISPTALLQ